MFFGEVFVGDDVDVVFFERGDEVFVPALCSGSFELFDAFFARVKGLVGWKVAGARWGVGKSLGVTVTKEPDSFHDKLV